MPRTKDKSKDSKDEAEEARMYSSGVGSKT